jgi:hypothetical protein
MLVEGCDEQNCRLSGVPSKREAEENIQRILSEETVHQEHSSNPPGAAEVMEKYGSNRKLCSLADMLLHRLWHAG